MTDASGIEGAQDRPGAVDVIHAPAAIPASLFHLRAAQIVDRARKRHTLRAALVDLRKHRTPARRYVPGRGFEKSAVVGERDIVEIVVPVVGVERAQAPLAL